MVELMEQLTPEEQSLVETFAMFVIDRRHLAASDRRDVAASAESLAQWLKTLGNETETDNSQGPAIERRSILELRGLGKDVWKDNKVEEYLERERDSWDG